jgi:hypothetical protein
MESQYDVGKRRRPRLASRNKVAFGESGPSMVNHIPLVSMTMSMELFGRMLCHLVNILDANRLMARSSYTMMTSH